MLSTACIFLIYILQIQKFQSGAFFFFFHNAYFVQYFCWWFCLAVLLFIGGLFFFNYMFSVVIRKSPAWHLQVHKH